MFEEYDKNREFALDKVTRSFTIQYRTYWKLKEEAEKEGISMSSLLDKKINRQSLS
ncbi:MAG: hypothetical protein V1921_04015 [Candidatus Altiarchaeota archaeon]